MGPGYLTFTSAGAELAQPELPPEPDRLPQQAVQKALAHLPGLEPHSKLEQSLVLVGQAVLALRLAQAAQQVAPVFPVLRDAGRHRAWGAFRPSAGGPPWGASRSHRLARCQRSGRISREFQDDPGHGLGSYVFRKPFARG